MTYQMIQSMENSGSSGPETYLGVSELDEALREAEHTGYVFDGDDVEGVSYDPDSIRDLLGQSSGGGY